ncbi:unnamed protein product [Nesidiocoris tenuis]|uniref:Uncharacterized protein n=1 Tax=Nesidiocoris tenuis TaxID=355587 RepID=A0A6H5G6X1_9HEMI|nr:unnamed protein product [Nesidiocoris tenuis]
MYRLFMFTGQDFAEHAGLHFSNKNWIDFSNEVRIKAFTWFEKEVETAEEPESQSRSDKNKKDLKEVFMLSLKPFQLFPFNLSLTNFDHEREVTAIAECTFTIIPPPPMFHFIDGQCALWIYNRPYDSALKELGEQQHG